MNRYPHWFIKRRMLAMLFVAVLTIVSCQPPKTVVEITPPPTPDTTLRPSPTFVSPPTMTLSARHEVTQYSPRQEPLPVSLDDIVPPPAESWQDVAPNSNVSFQNYDNLRVTGEGEALLDLGGFMHLLFKRDTVAQFTETDLAVSQLGKINVTLENTPLLQRLALSIHLLRGGFAGELEAGSEPVALTTPNAVVLVSGTTFFVAYDPTAGDPADPGRTWIGNFEGSINVGDMPGSLESALDDQQIMVIPPIDGRSVWDMPPGLSSETFSQFVDKIGSPIDTAAILSGPNISPKVGPGLDIFHGPGRELERLGILPVGTIATISRRAIGQDGSAYWQIVCPVEIGTPRRGCWVVNDPALATATNIENVDGVQSDVLTVTDPAGDCAATIDLPTYPYSANITLRWRSATQLGDDYLGLRLGPVGELLVLGTVHPFIHQLAPGEWAYAVPASAIYRSGINVYQWQVYRAANDGVIVAQSPTGCFQIDPPPATVTPVPDSDGDGWLDNVDRCPFRSAYPNPDPLFPGCPGLSPTPTNTPTPPAPPSDTFILEGPPVDNSGPDVNFRFSSNKPFVIYECSLDGGPYEGCPAEHELSGLDQGTHTLLVRAIAPAVVPNVDPTPANYTWDTLAEPDTSLLSGPEDLPGAFGATFTFTSNQQDATFECSVDEAPWEPCTSPYLVVPQAKQSSYTFAVRAVNRYLTKDGEPVVDRSPATYEQVVRPDTTIISRPEAQTESTRAAFTFSSDQPEATFECSLDSAIFTACESPLTLTELDPGAHEFQVRAVSPSGSVDPSPDIYKWEIVDVTPLETTIISGPNAKALETTAMFRFTSNESDASFECSLDGGPYSRCAYPPNNTASFIGLKAGEHTLLVRAVDSHLNIDETPEAYSWTILEPPVTSILSGPEYTTFETTATFTFEANQTETTFECALDGDNFTPCTSGISYFDLKIGGHLFMVRATNSLGLTEASSARYDWMIMDLLK